ncbi:MAG: RidA family protein [Nocardioidaceae bacterium]
MAHARQTVNATEAPLAVGPYSHAVQAGHVIYLSGQTPLDPATGELVSGDVTTQTKQVFANLSAVLVAAGLTFDHVVKANVFLTDLSDFAAMNEEYAQVFSEPFPARTTVAVAGLPLGASVEIELIAQV